MHQKDYKGALDAIEASHNDFGESELFLHIAEQALHKIFKKEVNVGQGEELRKNMAKLREKYPDALKAQQEKYENLIQIMLDI